MQNYNKTYTRSAIPTDLFGWMLLIFIIAAYNLFGYAQVKVIGILFAVFYALYFLKEKKSVPLEIVMFLVWLMWSLSGYFVCIDKESFLNTFTLVFQIVIMAFTISGVTSQQITLDTNFLAIFLGGVIFLIQGFSIESYQMALDPSEKRRVAGMILNSNTYAWLSLTIIFSASYFWKLNRTLKTKIILSIFILLACFGIIYSGSRKNFLGLIIFIVSWWWMCYRKMMIKKPTLLITFISVLILLFFIAMFTLSSTYMGERFHEDSPGELRISLYNLGFELFKSSPIFGVGLGNFAAHQASERESHSEYIEILASTGIVGFALYFSIYIILWCRLSRIQKRFNQTDIFYNAGVLKAIIITLLFVGFGRPHFTSIASWVLLSSAIAYAWSIENRFNNLV